MRDAVRRTAALLATLLLAVSAPLTAMKVVRYAATSGSIESVLLCELEGQHAQRLTDVTHLSDGTRLWEEARFDGSGALIRAQITRACPSGASDDAVLDVQTGVVVVRDSTGARRWSAPTDYPWFWAPRSCANGSQDTSVTTPLSALVAFRGGAAHGGVRRLLDPWRFVSHSVMGDQVVVEEDARSSWVVVGDDAVLIRDGWPERWCAHGPGDAVTRSDPLQSDCKCN